MKYKKRENEPFCGKDAENRRDARAVDVDDGHPDPP
jgi:hypothetical protein